MNAEKILKPLLKIAAVCLTAPATLAVFTSTLSGYGTVGRWIPSIAALVLIEGALLLGWQLLDEKGKTSEKLQRWLWAALVIVAYAALNVVAWQHGEGWAGILARGTVLVLIVYSIAEAGILADLRSDKAVDKDITVDRGVKDHRRKAEVKIAKLRIDLWQEEETAALQAHHSQHSKALEVDHKAALQAITRQHSGQSTPERGNLTYPIERVNKARQSRKSKRLEFIRSTHQKNPEMSPVEVVERLQSKHKVSASTAWADWSEYKGGNGNGNGNTTPEEQAA